MFHKMPNSPSQVFQTSSQAVQHLDDVLPTA